MVVSGGYGYGKLLYINIKGSWDAQSTIRKYPASGRIRSKQDMLDRL
jgi:hypothetical protein